MTATILAVVSLRLFCWDPFEGVFQPGSGVYAASLAAAEEGVYDCRADGRIVVTAEEVVLPADGQRTDCILHPVVVSGLVAAAGCRYIQGLSPFWISVRSGLTRSPSISRTPG